MHELSITQSMVEAIAEQTGGRRVLRVVLEIGRLSGVEVDAVRFCFDVVAAGTAVEGAELEIDEPQGQARCRQCGTTFEPSDPLAGCACGSLDLEVTSGEQLRIREVRVKRDVRDVRV
ncbi:hydrogenase maturation nickel metallochaperone HypA [Qaidamihabitans albus]|uniref:hydrogenase maturation nickel metallochaperone HypA n=1 Tax=Qaidamihabitans albus TaxID=2795733 RepID=UPI0018F206BF|nr:hydrogenase maturation nickel metallochaperone HypA [Qaidamihabitans albus]